LFQFYLNIQILPFLEVGLAGEGAGSAGFYSF